MWSPDKRCQLCLPFCFRAYLFFRFNTSINVIWPPCFFCFFLCVRCAIVNRLLSRAYFLTNFEPRVKICHQQTVRIDLSTIKLPYHSWYFLLLTVLRWVVLVLFLSLILILCSSLWGRGTVTLLSLVCGLTTVCHGLFALPLVSLVYRRYSVVRLFLAVFYISPFKIDNTPF